MPINDFVTGVLDRDITPRRKTNLIVDRAHEVGATADDLVQNSPLTMDQINKHIGLSSRSLPSPSSVSQDTGGQVSGGSPSYGLGGAEQSIRAGSQMGLDKLGDTQQQIANLFGGSMEGIGEFIDPGQQANTRQAVLSGALGPDRQQQAFEEYTQSPGVQFAQGQAERSLMRNAAATGGLGGGNVLRDLTKLAAGTAMQDFGNQFNRLGQVADRGLSAAQQTGQLAGQQAGIQSALGQTMAEIPVSTGSEVGRYRYQAGRDLSQNIGETTSALANLTQQQGAGLTDIVSRGTTNLQNLFDQATQGDTQAKMQLASMLSNLSTQQASQVGGQPITQQPQTTYLSDLGSILSATGGVMDAYEEV